MWKVNRLIIACVSLIVISCNSSSNSGGGTGGARDSGASPQGGIGGASNSGAGGTSSGGAAGLGGSGSGGVGAQTAGVVAFCLAQNRALCSLAFQCVPAASRDIDFLTTFGSSLAECQGTIVPSLCTTAATDCPAYDAHWGDLCVSGLLSYTCSDVVDLGEPVECSLACSSSPGTGGAIGSGGRTGSGGAIGFGGAPGSGGATALGGAVGSGGRPGTGGMVGSGGVTGSGGKPSGTGGSSGQLPLCPADYETADCPLAGQSCRIDCPSKMCGCTCMSMSSSQRWSCLLL